MEESSMKTTKISQEDTNKKEKKRKAKKVSAKGKKEFDWGFWFLSFFLPIPGYILYLNWKQKKPIKSNSCGWGSLLGSVFYVVLVVIIILIIGNIKYR